MSSEEDSEEISYKNLSYEVARILKGIDKKKEKKKKRILKSEARLNESKTIKGKKLKYNWKKYKKKKEIDNTSIDLSDDSNCKSEMSNSNGYHKESTCYNRKIVDEL